MSTASSTTKEIEARLLLQQDDEVDDIIELYRQAMQHIGFHDRRSDKRFVVKYPMIIAYSPIDHPCFDSLFNEFIHTTYDNLIEELNDQGINPDDYLTRMTVGHYQAFRYNIPDITADNALDVAREFYDEFAWTDCTINEQITIINALTALEDTYYAQWLEFLDVNGETEILTITKENYGRTNQTHTI